MPSQISWWKWPARFSFPPLPFQISSVPAFPVSAPDFFSLPRVFAVAKRSGNLYFSGLYPTTITLFASVIVGSVSVTFTLFLATALLKHRWTSVLMSLGKPLKYLSHLSSRYEADFSHCIRILCFFFVSIEIPFPVLVFHLKFELCGTLWKERNPFRVLNPRERKSFSGEEGVLFRSQKDWNLVGAAP